MANNKICVEDLFYSLRNVSDELYIRVNCKLDFYSSTQLDFEMRNGLNAELMNELNVEIAIEMHDMYNVNKL